MNSEDLNKSLGKKNPERKIMDEEDRDSMPDLEVLEKIVDKELKKLNAWTESEKMQEELEPIYHPTEHDESDDIEDAKRLEESGEKP